MEIQDDAKTRTMATMTSEWEFWHGLYYKFAAYLRWKDFENL